MARWYLVIAEGVFVLVLGVVTVLLFWPHAPAGAVKVEVRLPDPSSQVYLRQDASGGLNYLVRHGDGQIESFSPAQMTERLYEAGRGGTGAGQGGLSAARAALGLSSPVVALWLSIGFLGQVLFTGRMVVQWVVSERSGKSVVPPLFWWMSLLGSIVLLAYFLWRRDPIGLIGQAFGSFIYLRNIMWIRSEARDGVTA